MRDSTPDSRPCAKFMEGLLDKVTAHLGVNLRHPLPRHLQVHLGETLTPKDETLTSSQMLSAGRFQCPGFLRFASGKGSWPRQQRLLMGQDCACPRPALFHSSSAGTAKGPSIGQRAEQGQPGRNKPHRAAVFIQLQQYLQ